MMAAAVREPPARRAPAPPARRARARPAPGARADRPGRAAWPAGPAIDPAKLAQGGIDPSYPAFRLQFQGLQEDNHRAYWTLDVRYPDKPPPPPTDGGMCIASMAACDPVADECCDSDEHCDTIDNGKTYTCGLFLMK